MLRVREFGAQCMQAVGRTSDSNARMLHVQTSEVALWRLMEGRNVGGMSYGQSIRQENSSSGFSLLDGWLAGWMRADRVGKQEQKGMDG